MANKKEGKNKIPIEEVVSMKQQGLSNSEIIENLKNLKYSQQQISDALNQADIKKGIALSEVPTPEEAEPPRFQEQPMQEIPTPDLSEPSYYSEFTPEPRHDIERIEEIAESVVQEKWQDLVRNIGDISLWKEKVNTDIVSVKQEIIRMQSRIENINKAVLSKVSEYGKDIKSVNVEVRALEKVLEKILTPLTTNIKELSKITAELKKKK